MLSTGDLNNNQPLLSVLNVVPIDNAGKMLIQFVGHPIGEAGSNTPATRRWLDSTLSMFLTMTNLRGLPYKIDFNAGAPADPYLQQNFVNHADFVRFELDMRPGVEIPVRPDAFGVSLWRDGDAFVGWDGVAPFGVATGAFPIGFKARDLSRPLDQYAYRIITSTDVAGKAGHPEFRVTQTFRTAPARSAVPQPTDVPALARLIPSIRIRCNSSG